MFLRSINSVAWPKITAFGKVLIFVPMVILCLPNIVSNSTELESSGNEDIGSISKVVFTNSSNNSSTCHFKIVESTLKNVVKLMQDKKTNVIALDVWMEMGNNTLNQTLILTGIKWANEIGRALIPLIAHADDSFFSTILSSYTTTLTAGVHYADIFVTKEETKCCLLTGNNTWESAIFDLLVLQLFHVSDDDTDYQLCRAHDDENDATKYNYKCCAIKEKKNISVCSDYSSMVTQIVSAFMIIAIFSFICLFFPLILEYTSRFREESKHYKISDSPMSVSSILHAVFIDGHGPAKSVGRRLVIVVFLFVTVLPPPAPDLVIEYIVVGLWGIIFPFIDTPNLNENDYQQHVHNKFEFFGARSPVAAIVLPFNLKLWWHKVNHDWPFFYNHLKLNLNQGSSLQRNSEITERSRLLGQSQEDSSLRLDEHGSVSFIEKMKYRLSILFLLVLYLILIVPCYFLCLSSFSGMIFFKYVVKLADAQKKSSKMPVYCINLFLLMCITIVTEILIFVSLAKFPLLMSYFTIGLFLNGQVYSVYFVPLCTILFYSWTNWRFSVETRYLELNMKIYEVCKKSVPVGENNESSESADDTPQTSTTFYSTKVFKIELDKSGEPNIPKQLYDKVRQKFLPYDEVLYHYFVGVSLVAIFAYFLFIMMSLGQKSGIPESTQIIGIMAATSLPFIFDLVWKKNSNEQKAANNSALKSKLKRLLLVRTSDRVTGEISVEFKGDTPRI